MHQFALSHKGFLVITDIAVDVTPQQILLFQVREGLCLGQSLILTFFQQCFIDAGIRRKEIGGRRLVHVLGLLHLVYAPLKGIVIFLLEHHNCPDGIDIGQTPVEVPRISVFSQHFFRHIKPVKGLRQTVIQMYMRQGEIDKGQTVILKPRSLDLFSRLQEFRLGTGYITTGVIHMSHHIRHEVPSFLSELIALYVTFQSLNDMVGRRNIHFAQTIHDAAHPGCAGFKHIVISHGMLTKSQTSIIDHLL